MDQLELTIINREGIVLKTKVNAITSFNSKGKFDILPTHANYISLIEKKIIYFDKDNHKYEYPIERALLKVALNKISVFLTI